MKGVMSFTVAIACSLSVPARPWNLSVSLRDSIAVLDPDVEFTQLSRRIHVAGCDGVGIPKRATFEFRKVLGYPLTACTGD